jgi:hypothetical protein
MSDKYLIVFFGESFKQEKNKEKQYVATQSHIELINFINKRYNLQEHIFLNTLKINKEYDELLVKWYQKLNITTNFHEKKLPSDQHIYVDTIYKIQNLVKDTNYKFILLINLNLFIKPYFHSSFKLSDKVMYTHIEPNNKYNNFASVCYKIIYVPNKYFKNLFDMELILMNESGSLAQKNIGKNIDLFINTVHLDSTDKEWNPLYVEINKEESTLTPNKNKCYNIDTNTYYTLDNCPVYDTLIKKDTFYDKLKNIMIM